MRWYQVLIAKYYWLIIIIFLFATFFVGYFGIIKPKMDQTTNGGLLDLKTRQEILKEQKAYLEKLKKMKQESEEINFLELEKIKYVLAEKIDVPLILKQIKALAEQSDLDLINFSFDFKNGILTIKLDFKKGNYQLVKKYLAEIEKNIRIMDVREISLTGVGSGASLVIQSYYLE